MRSLPEEILDLIISRVGTKLYIDEAEDLVEEILRLVRDWLQDSLYE